QVLEQGACTPVEVAARAAFPAAADRAVVARRRIAEPTADRRVVGDRRIAEATTHRRIDDRSRVVAAAAHRCELGAGEVETAAAHRGIIAAGKIAAPAADGGIGPVGAVEVAAEQAAVLRIGIAGADDQIVRAAALVRQPLPAEVLAIDLGFEITVRADCRRVGIGFVVAHGQVAETVGRGGDAAAVDDAQVDAVELGGQVFHTSLVRVRHVNEIQVIGERDYRTPLYRGQLRLQGRDAAVEAVDGGLLRGNGGL